MKKGGGARYTDPRTSHEAAASIDVTEKEDRVYCALIKTSTHGATWDELVSLTGMPRQSISPRLKPLREKGLATFIIDPATGREKTRMGHCGKQQLVHIAVRAAKLEREN